MKKHLLKHALLALYVIGSGCLVNAQNRADKVIAQQDFNHIQEAQSETFDQVKSGTMLTNSGSTDFTTGKLGFRTYWTDTRTLGSGPLHSDQRQNDLSDFIGVNAFAGENAPDISPTGWKYQKGKEQNFEINDGDGRIELIFDPVELMGFVDRKLTLSYWINAAEYEDQDAFQIKLMDGVQFYTALSLRAISLNQQGSADDGSSNWKKLVVDLDKLIEEGFKEVMTLIVAVDNNANDENIFIDEITFSGVPMASSCTEIFISEFVSGGQHEHCLELFNPSRKSIDLMQDDYQVRIYLAGQNRPLNTIQLKGTVAPGETLVLCDASIHPDFKVHADVLIYEPFFKHGSVVELMHHGVPIDVVGQIGKITDLGPEVSLRRRTDISHGENSGANVFSPAKEWKRLSKLSTRDLGKHRCDCQTTPCLIEDMEVIITTACNDNSTTGPFDDYVLGDVIVHFTGRPIKGLLRLEGATQAEIGVGTLGQTSYRFKDVKFAANGKPIALAAYFTEWDGCKKTMENLAMAPWSCSEQNERDVTPVDNTFVYEPLKKEPKSPTPTPINEPEFKKYGTTSVVNPNLPRYTDPRRPSYPVTKIGFEVSEPCFGQNTNSTTDDIFLGSVRVNFPRIPDFGFLELTGVVNVKVPVEHLKGTTYSFDFLEMPANGLPFYLHAKFSATTTKQDKKTALFQAPASCSDANRCRDLFISEYVEGSGKNRCLEFYNPAFQPINLTEDEYHIRIFFKGEDQPGSVIPLKGVINGHSTFVVCADESKEEVQSYADQLSAFDFFTGDDAVVLYKGEQVLDVIGQVGFDPGFSWRAGELSTKNKSLRRRVLVTKGQQNRDFDLAGEWWAHDKNTFKGLGEHKCICEAEKANELVQTSSTCGDGLAQFDLETSTWTLSTSCASSSPYQDLMTFEYEAICGNFDLVVEQLASSENALGGIMVREGLDADAKFLALGIDETNQLIWKVRPNKSAPSTSETNASEGKTWLRVVRKDEVFEAYVAREDRNWELVAQEIIGTRSCLNVGVWVEGKQEGLLAQAEFSELIWQAKNGSNGVTYEQHLIPKAPLVEPISEPKTIDLDLPLPAVSTWKRPQITGQWDLRILSSQQDQALFVHARTDQNDQIEVRIIDAEGQTWFQAQENCNNRNLPIDLDALELPIGVYWITAIAGQQAMAKKFVSYKV